MHTTIILANPKTELQFATSHAAIDCKSFRTLVPAVVLLMKTILPYFVGPSIHWRLWRLRTISPTNYPSSPTPSPFDIVLRWRHVTLHKTTSPRSSAVSHTAALLLAPTPWRRLHHHPWPHTDPCHSISAMLLSTMLSQCPAIASLQYSLARNTVLHHKKKYDPTN